MPDAIDQTAALFHQEINPQARRASPAANDGGAKKPTEEVFQNLSRVMEEEDDEQPKARKDAKNTGDVDEDFLDQLDEGGDEDAGDDADADADDEDADADDDKKGDEEEEDDDPEMNKKFAVTVDGEEVEVTLKEALNGYIRQDTFSTRLNKLTEFANGLREEAGTVTEAREELIKQLEEAEQMYTAVLPPEPDWDALYKADPAKARNMEKGFKEVRAKIDEIKAKTAKARQEQAETAARDLQKFADREFPRFAQKARWKDKKHMEKDLASMKRTAMAVGFSEGEAGSVVDSRMLTILLKASKYDRMVSNKPRPVNVPGNGATRKGTGAGPGNSRTAPKALVTAQRQHERAGSIDSAASVFEQQLALERRSKRRG